MHIIDRTFTRLFDADLRLLYGVTVPILMVCGLVALLSLSPAWWLLGAVMLGELLLTAVVITGLASMLAERDEQPAPPPQRSSR